MGNDGICHKECQLPKRSGSEVCQVFEQCCWVGLHCDQNIPNTWKSSLWITHPPFHLLRIEEFSKIASNIPTLKEH
jgi:hypothetical protein